MSDTIITQLQRLLHTPRAVLTSPSVAIVTAIAYEHLPVALLPQIAHAYETAGQGVALLIVSYSVAATMARVAPRRQPTVAPRDVRPAD